MEDDGWDLQAVVRGCCGSVRSTSEAVATVDPFSFLPVVAKKEKEEEDDLLRYLPEVFSTQREVHELEELCKPFFTKSFDKQQQKQLSPEGRPSSCSAAHPRPSYDGGAASLPLQQQQQHQQHQQIRQPQVRPFSQTPRAKRRKNQQKKVVCQVPADGLSSDMWAWRKYGQKPIKGSPYPRGYYRCSSSKGCLARKQVERSRTDPDTLVITYTAEHNHPVPTHRNSLAGSTRQKFPSSSSSAGSAQNFAGVDGGGTPVGGSDPEPTSSKGTSSSPIYSPTAAGLSPTTPLTSSMEEELLRPQRLTGQKPEGEEAEEEEEEEDDDEENLLLIGDMEILGDDDLMFMDFDQLRDTNAATAFSDGFSERFGSSPHPWMPSGAATAAGGG